MRMITRAFCLPIFACGTVSASETQHSAIVDMPKVATLNHASPNTWHTLPAVQPNDVRTTATLLFAQAALVELTCDTIAGDQSRNSVSLVEFF